jgi:hypothetical protein
MLHQKKRVERPWPKNLQDGERVRTDLRVAMHGRIGLGITHEHVDDERRRGRREP